MGEAPSHNNDNNKLILKPLFQGVLLIPKWTKNQYVTYQCCINY